MTSTRALAQFALIAWVTAATGACSRGAGESPFDDGLGSGAEDPTGEGDVGSNSAGESASASASDTNGDAGSSETGEAASCTDEILNGDETDVDCGGSCPPCDQGEGCELPDDCGAGVCDEGVCCTSSTYEKSTGQVSGVGSVCCDGADLRIDLVACGTGQNYSVAPEGDACASTSEGANNNGSACVSITCEHLDCTPGDDPSPWAGPAGPEVWSMAGVFVYDPKTFDPATFGPVLAQNHFGWVALQIVDGTTEKWPCAAEPCGTDTARGWIEAWREHVPWVGAWGVNRANADQGAVENEAQVAVDLLGAYDAEQAWVDFYIADAEAEYEYSKCGACVSASSWWSARFRAARPEGTFEVALSSYGRTDLADLDWMIWRDRGFAFLPQTYWNDPNAGAAFAPALGVDYAQVCPGSESAATKGLNCAGSPTDCPCWAASSIHPTIGLGWGSEPPTAGDYVASMIAAHGQLGMVGFSIFEGQYVPAASPTWAELGQAIAQHGIATMP